MKLHFLLFFGLLSCLFNQHVHSQSGITDKSTGEVFPREVSFEYGGKQYQLEATGVSTRRILIIKVYSIASYLQKGAPGDKLQAILSDANAKQLTMKWVHDASPEKIKNGFDESLHRVFTPEQYKKMQKDINSFVNLFTQNANKGDQYVFRWIPGGHIEVLINGKPVGGVTGQEFAKGVWNIWFGPKSVVDVNELLSY